MYDLDCCLLDTLGSVLTYTPSTDAMVSQAVPISNPLGHSYARERFCADTYEGRLKICRDCYSGAAVWK